MNGYKRYCFGTGLVFGTLLAVGTAFDAGASCAMSPFACGGVWAIIMALLCCIFCGEPGIELPPAPCMGLGGIAAVGMFIPFCFWGIVDLLGR